MRPNKLSGASLTHTPWAAGIADAYAVGRMTITDCHDALMDLYDDPAVVHMKWMQIDSPEEQDRIREALFRYPKDVW